MTRSRAMGLVTLATELPPTPPWANPLLWWAFIASLILVGVLVKWIAPRIVREWTKGSGKSNPPDAPDPADSGPVHTAQIEAHMAEDDRRFTEITASIATNHRETISRLDRVIELHTAQAATQAAHAARLSKLEYDAGENTGTHKTLARIETKLETHDKEIEKLRARLSGTMPAVKPRM